MEKTILIKVDEDFHREMKVRATLQGLTIKAYLVSLIKSDLEHSKREQAPTD